MQALCTCHTPTWPLSAQSSTEQVWLSHRLPACSPCPLLQYLSKIKVQQIEKDRGEWDSLSQEARREKESSLQMFGQLARFHNIMSNETIGTLAFLTSGRESNAGTRSRALPGEVLGRLQGFCGAQGAVGFCSRD